MVFGEEDPKDEKAVGYVWAGTLLHTAKHAGTRNSGTNCKRGKRRCVAWASSRRPSKL